MADPTVTTQADFERYFRIAMLLIDKGTKVLQRLFDSIHEPSSLMTVLQRHKGILKRLLPKDDWKMLYPTNCSCVESGNFDISLLFMLFRNICNLTEPTSGWVKQPSDTDLTLEADIVRIKNHRNDYAHKTNTQYSEPEFNECWEQIRGALLRIIGDHRYKPLVSVAEYERQIDEILTSETSSPTMVIHCFTNVFRFGRWVVENIWEYYRENIEPLFNQIQDAIFADAGIIVQMINEGSLMIQIRAKDLDALEEFWKRYQSGELKDDLEKVLLTEEIRKLGEQVNLTVHVSEDEYLLARFFLEELLPYREAVKEVTETIEALSLDGDEISLVHGPINTDRESKFQAHFAEVTSEEKVYEVLSIITKRLRRSEASNIIWAYRVLEPEKGDYIHASNDGGEYLAGRRLEHILQEICAVNVVVIVTCWEVDGYLDTSEKLQNINECALNLLMAHEMVPRISPEEVVLFLKKTEEKFEARKLKAAHAAYADKSEQKSSKFEIIHSETITVPKSSFQGHLARVTSQDQVDHVIAQLKEDRNIKLARFNMFAYRIYDEERKEYIEGENDDGENKGGKKLQKLLQAMNAKNVVIIVSRWKEGDVKIGSLRFKCIVDCATEVIKAGTDQETSPKFEIIHSETISVPKSSFQGHLARVTSQDQVDKVLDQLKKDPEIQKARFNMFAYRIFDEKRNEYLEIENDDGENKGGEKLLKLLQAMNAKNVVVVVSRWKEGDVKIGSIRFKFIVDCATEVIEAVTAQETLSKFEIFHSETISVPKSSFQSHLARVTSKNQVDQVLDQLKEDPEIQKARFNMFAYRIFDKKRNKYIEDENDDGENKGGETLLKLLQTMDVNNVVVIVSRWKEGDVKIGSKRFKFINDCAAEAIKTAFGREMWLKFEIIHSEMISVPKSSFQGHLARVTSQDQVDQVLTQLKVDPKIQKARFNMFAYRIFDEEKKTHLEGESDDGENRGGKRLMELLQISNVKNVIVVVSRWKEGEVKIGSKRFKFIVDCAKEVIKMATNLGWICKEKASSAEPKTKGRKRTSSTS